MGHRGLRFCSEEEWKLSKVDMGMVGSVAMGLMRPTANGAPFLGCRGWMWVVCEKSVVGCGWFVANRWSEEGDRWFEAIR